MIEENFRPLTWIRSVDQLRCGATTIGEHKPLKRKINYLWDLLAHLGEDLEDDFRILGKGVKGKIHPSAVIYNAENVLIEEGAEIEALAVLDARSGPIYIGKNSVIRPQSYLRGPLSIGPECRIGGEVAHSIFHGFSNKAHYGFIGHSYVGEWVNLGAGTTNSNLKNNYGTVKVYNRGKLIDTDQQFMGCFIGDHSATAIGTMIYTGCVIGVGANIFGVHHIKKFVPSFSWGETGEAEIDKACAAARAMMSRRNIEFSAEYDKLFRKVFVDTRAEREGPQIRGQGARKERGKKK